MMQVASINGLEPSWLNVPFENRVVSFCAMVVDVNDVCSPRDSLKLEYDCTSLYFNFA